MTESSMAGPIQLNPAQQEVAGRVIAALAGPDARLRPDQETAVAALATPGARALVVQATGWGKSAVYWAATAVIRQAGAGNAASGPNPTGGGPTLIVSPLLSLMRDQVAAATRAGLRAATLNSSNVDDWAAIEHDLTAGELDVLLVSPERLANPGFGRRVLDTLAGRLGLVVIDEAHAISDWGHDFRPDYRRVADVLQRLNPQTSVLATTATANERVTHDVAQQLQSGGGTETLVLRGPLARKSLHLNVIDGLSPIERYGWVADQLPSLPGSGIVYVLTVADADRLVTAIRAVHGDDYPVAAYTGQLPPDERHRLEDDLLANRVKALVATSALGMGFDKPDLGFVVHVGAPPSPVSYYQQVGRAGRALDEAVVVLLASAMDEAVWEYFATATIPDPQRMERLLSAMAAEDRPVSVPQLEALTGMRRTRVELMCKQLAVDGAVERTADGWVRTGQGWSYDAEHYAGVLAVRRREADIMRRYIGGRDCLMKLLTQALDDPRAADCGRCSVCRRALTPPLTETVPREALGTVSAALRRQAQVLEPRKMWPGGVFGTRGRIPAGQLAETGRVLAFADAPQWEDTLRAIRGSGDAAAREQAWDELTRAAVEVLAQWGRAGIRPELICGLDLGTGMATELAARLRAVGRRGGGDYPVQPGPGPGRDANGAAEAAHWRDRLGEPPAGTGESVLLVVDETSSTWPIALAAAALREAGAGPVLPLLIHQSV
ncbi:DEAD/DEAH box helicase [Gordonia sp. PP30]|uniref:RecQ family ATP-dependent DNA helicase n=1 Tax=Gordonia sp. PP30 TaxID=2935861 RepID=UPI00200050A0|nr:DEAD/DEAH box helicase [Gordonia sp. PP30]UQE74675.1 DEAD/DEAH box helicase [Gordonia sp. PP30]